MPLRQTTDLDDRPRPSAQHEPPAPSFGLLARRIAIWTTRGLACALVMVTAVGFGVQTLRWWRTEPSAILPHRAALEEPLGDQNQWHVITFAGQPWQIHHRMLHGDNSAAVESLRLRCRAALKGSSSAGVPATPAEVQLLEQLAGSKPIDEQPGRWKLYCHDQTMPMLIGVSQAGIEQAQPKPSGAAEHPRVLIWALAAQQAAEIWSLYVFEPQEQRSGGAATSGGEVRVDLPPGAVRTLQLAVAPGGTVAAFRTPTSPDACQRFFDEWFAAQRWMPLSGWQRYGTNTRCARFRHTGQDVSADVHLSEVHFGGVGRQTSGLVLLWQGGH